MSINESGAKRMLKPPLVIDAGHYERLLSLAERSLEQAPDLANQLLEEVERADLRDSAAMPADVVNIGSEVTYRDENSGRTHVLRLVYPKDADIESRRVSVLTPIGAALIGLSAGQRMTWEMHDGQVKHLTVVDVAWPSGKRDDGGKH